MLHSEHIVEGPVVAQVKQLGSQESQVHVLEFSHVAYGQCPLVTIILQ